VACLAKNLPVTNTRARDPGARGRGGGDEVSRLDTYPALSVSWRVSDLAYGAGTRISVPGAFWQLPCHSSVVGVVHLAQPLLSERSRTTLLRCLAGHRQSVGREEPPTLDELNAYFEAWLAERYHRDVHSETGEAPRDRFQRTAILGPAPELAQVDELPRLRERRRVHKKWSTVEVLATRYVVDPALRGRRVDVLYDPFAPEYVLIVFEASADLDWRTGPGGQGPTPGRGARPLFRSVAGCSWLRRSRWSDCGEGIAMSTRDTRRITLDAGLTALALGRLRVSDGRYAFTERLRCRRWLRRWLHPRASAGRSGLLIQRKEG